jgi:peptidoglycan L-alanyl-D-glutamate endopeptidase CwlK
MTPVEKPNRDLALLHPAFREAVEKVLAELAAEKIPFELFEGFRSAERQGWLYAQGRTRVGPIVTRALPWWSYHQYGLGADFVLRYDDPTTPKHAIEWSWRGDPGWWKRLHEVGRAHGLEPLSFEAPHLQLAGLQVVDLRAGRLPAGGDAGWMENLAACARSAELGCVAVVRALG